MSCHWWKDERLESKEIFACVEAIRGGREKKYQFGTESKERRRKERNRTKPYGINKSIFDVTCLWCLVESLFLEVSARIFLSESIMMLHYSCLVRPNTVAE